MKKILASILTIFIAFSIITGCSNNKTNNDYETSNQDKIITESNNDFTINDIKNINWFVEESIIDGFDVLSFNYTNNTSFTITDVEMKFKLKDSVTIEQLNTFEDVFEDINEENYKDEMDSFYILCYNRKFAEPGETVNFSPCSIRGRLQRANNMELFNLTEPSRVDVCYIGNDKKIYALSYDFFDNKIRKNSKVFEPNNWSDTKLGQMVPHVDSEYVNIKSDDSNRFSFTAFDYSKEMYEEYIKKCKDSGFINNQYNHQNRYKAYNNDNYLIKVEYDEIEETLTVRIWNME